MFQREDSKFADAPQCIRRSLINASQGSVGMTKLRDAARALREPVETPAYRGDAWAHVAFPRRKVAVLVRTNGATVSVAEQRKRWYAAGFALLDVRAERLNKRTVDEVAAMLKKELTTCRT